MEKSAYLQTMMTQALKAMKNAHAPYSKFYVGCSIKTINNQFFAGCNVENAAYPSSQCAESTAIGSMITEGERHITDLLIIHDDDQPCMPCGNCRQKISEFATPDTKIHLANTKKLLLTLSFSEILPQPFTSEKLATTKGHPKK